MGSVSSVIRDASRQPLSEAGPQLHAAIFDEVVPLGPRADAGAPIYDERHCIQKVGQQMIARDGRRELRSGAVALFQPQTAAQAKEVHLEQTRPFFFRFINLSTQSLLGLWIVLPPEACAVHHK